MLICCSRKISHYHQWWKQLCCFISSKNVEIIPLLTSIPFLTFYFFSVFPTLLRHTLRLWLISWFYRTHAPSAASVWFPHPIMPSSLISKLLNIICIYVYHDIWIWLALNQMLQAFHLEFPASFSDKDKKGTWGKTGNQSHHWARDIMQGMTVSFSMFSRCITFHGGHVSVERLSNGPIRTYFSSVFRCCAWCGCERRETFCTFLTW